MREGKNLSYKVQDQILQTKQLALLLLNAIRVRRGFLEVSYGPNVFEWSWIKNLRGRRRNSV